MSAAPSVSRPVTVLRDGVGLASMTVALPGWQATGRWRIVPPSDVHQAGRRGEAGRRGIARDGREGVNRHVEQAAHPVTPLGGGQP